MHTHANTNSNSHYLILKALDHGFADTALALVELNANISRVDKDGLSILHYAVRRSSQY